MYRDFYHLEYVPFTATPDSDLMNLSRRHQAVLERVVKGLNKQQSLIVFLGKAGLGKVALLRSALAAYSDSKHKAILIDIRKTHFHNQIYFKDIIKAVYEEIGYEIKYQVSPDALIDLHDIFIEEREKNSNFIIIINHAHLLPREVLKSIPKLIDAYPYEQPLGQLILAGDPVSEKQLRDPSLQPLKKRVQLIAKLDTFNRKESMAHIQRKLSNASPKGTPKVFSNAAIRKIVKAANGIPRNLNMLCTDALVAGCRRHKRPIPASIVKQVLADFQVHRKRRTPRLIWLGVAVVLLLALAAGAGIKYPDSFSGYLQMAAQWPQQVIEQVQPLLSGRTQKAEVRPEQAPKQEVRPMSVEAPVAIPVERPSPDGVMSPPLPQITPKPSPSKTVDEAPLPPREDGIEQVVNLIDQHFPKGGAFGLEVWSNKAQGKAYAEGEKLILYVRSESRAFLRIDYYQANGKIVHLLPDPLISNQARAGQRFTIGGSGSTFQFKVAPPFGTEMLTVMASQKPINRPTETETGELNDRYLSELSRQLRTYVTQGEAAAAYIRIQTQP
ncbi:DUF4384 domain-containing protein [Candidatus Entotheonella palauensis]|uniref:DUF4384 domain-containing protein n=1 Tax=Candidatus Entotheonella palauensis TaxID=93172 RepID=UPI000B7F412D|nr:DUF4384 domain-containing protein [Candidatus Entotheonella palauensis]